VLVVIDKLPFASPSDPMMQIRLEAISRQGGRPFMDYQLPQAMLTLKQGVGRLIRDFDDYGVVVLGDPRIRSKGYGRGFVKGLPRFRITLEREDAVEFLANHGAAAAPEEAAE